MAISKRSYRRWAKEHPNFMTPSIEMVMPVGKRRGIEISSGSGIMGNDNRIYGVTLFKERKTGGFRTGFKGSKMFHSESEAYDYARAKKRRR